MRFQKIFRFTLGSRILAIKVNAWNQELHTHYGITNETHDKMYVPFWDFIEDTPLYKISRSLEEVQEDEDLGTIYLIQTFPKQSYRAVSFNKLYWKEYIKILASTDFIDMSYLKHSVMRGRAVIRISNKDGTKNELIDTLLGRDWDDVSNDHQAIFSSIFKDIPKPNPMPKSIKVRLSKYESFR